MSDLCHFLGVVNIEPDIFTTNEIQSAAGMLWKWIRRCEISFTLFFF